MLDESKLKVANNILKKIKTELKKSDERFILECYQNGRESGFYIANHLSGKFVAFSNDRNSDKIVVYYVSNIFSTFSVAGNIPSDEAYQNRKFFNYDKTNDASKFIIEFLTGVKNA